MSRLRLAQFAAAALLCVAVTAAHAQAPPIFKDEVETAKPRDAAPALPAVNAAAPLLEPANANAPSAAPASPEPSTAVPVVPNAARAAARAASAPPTGPPRLGPRESIPPAELEAFVDATLRLALDEQHVVGASVAVVQDGRVVLAKGYGFASLDPAKPVDAATTLFRIGSITNTFTWIAVQNAIAAGKLDLDAPIDQYLPPDLRVPGDGFTQPIRMRDLVTHSAGFDDRVLGSLFVLDPAQLRPLAKYLVEDRPTRVRPPGVLASYSNYGAGLAGAVVAAVNGAAWEDVVEREILRPLRLEHVSVREPYAPRADLPAPMSEALARDLSQGFRWNGVRAVPRAFEHIAQIAPAGVASASAGDMARYLLLLLGDGTLDDTKVFGPAAARAFRMPLTALPVPVGKIDGGFFESVQPGGFRGYGHDGGTLSFFSNMVVVPELRLGIFITTNTQGGGSVVEPFPARVIENFYAPPRAPPLASAANAAALEAYVGEYLGTRRRYAGLEGLVFRFRSALEVSVAGNGDLLVGGRRFAPTPIPDVFSAVDEPTGAAASLKFQRDGERVVRVDAVASAFERVGTFYRQQTFELVASLGLVAAVAVVLSALRRFSVRPAASWGQRAAGRTQLAIAVLWLVSFGGFGLWATRVADPVAAFAPWPSSLVLAASTAALLASVLTLLSAPLLPAVWRGNEHGYGWSGWRKVRYTAAFIAFSALAIVAGGWGALEPWRP